MSKWVNLGSAGVFGPSRHASLKRGFLRDRLKLAGRQPLLPLRSPVQSQTGICVGVQQLFELGPNLEKVELGREHGGSDCRM